MIVNRWKSAALIIFCVLFVGVNLYLLLKEDSKAARVAYVEDWLRVKQDDITEKFDTKGVLKPLEEFSVYVDGDKQPIESFHVKKGDQVSPGTPLFTYSAEKLEDEKKGLEEEKTKLQGEIAAVQDHIRKLKSYQNSISVPTSKVDEEKEYTAEKISESQIEQEIYKQELAEDRLEKEAVKIDAQIAYLNQKINNLTVTSKVEGTVTELNQDLQSPVIKIASSDLGVEGLLTEVQRKKAEEGMRVVLYSPLYKKKLEGSIRTLHTYPANEPHVEKETVYPFTASLNEPDSELLAGAKLDVTVIVNEAKNVPVIPNRTLFKEDKKYYVYRLSDSGWLEKQRVNKGLTFAGKQEIQKGLKKKDLVAKDPMDVKVENVPVITPLHTSKIQMKELKGLSKKQTLQYVLMGMLER